MLGGDDVLRQDGRRSRDRVAVAPQRARRRHQPAREGAAAAGTRRDRAARRAPGRRRRAGVGHQRQDHQLDPGGGGARPRATRCAGTAPARTSCPASPARCSTPRPGPGSGCSRWTSSRCPRWRAGRGRARCCSEPVPRPARPVRRAGAGGRAVAGDGGRAAAGDDARAVRRRPGRQRARRRPRPRRPIRARRPLGGAGGASPTRPTRPRASGAGPRTRYAAVYLGHLGDYRCPNCGHARPPLDVAVRDVELRGLDGSAFEVGRRRRLAARRCPASTTSRTRPAPSRSPRRSASRPAVAAYRIGGRAGGVRPVRAGRRRRPRRRAPAGEEPGRRERGAADARAERRRAPCCCWR